jgi:hypothetical protein
VLRKLNRCQKLNGRQGRRQRIGDRTFQPQNETYANDMRERKREREERTWISVLSV